MSPCRQDAPKTLAWLPLLLTSLVPCPASEKEWGPRCKLAQCACLSSALTDLPGLQTLHAWSSS